MRTDFPTTDIYFVLAMTYCKLAVYKKDETFARNLLTELKAELLAEPPENVQEVDTQILLGLVKDFLPPFISRVAKGALTNTIEKAFL